MIELRESIPGAVGQFGEQVHEAENADATFMPLPAFSWVAPTYCV